MSADLVMQFYVIVKSLKVCDIKVKMKTDDKLENSYRIYIHLYISSFNTLIMQIILLITRAHAQGIKQLSSFNNSI